MNWISWSAEDHPFIPHVSLQVFCFVLSQKWNRRLQMWPRHWQGIQHGCSLVVCRMGFLCSDQGTALGIDHLLKFAKSYNDIWTNHMDLVWSFISCPRSCDPYKNLHQGFRRHMEFILISPVEVIGYHLWTRKHRPVFREHDSEAVLDAFL